MSYLFSLYMSHSVIHVHVYIYIQIRLAISSKTTEPFKVYIFSHYLKFYQKSQLKLSL